MTDSDYKPFVSEMKRLTDAFPGRISKSFEESLGTWFRKLDKFPLSSVRGAIDHLIDETDRFPTLGQMRSACDQHRPSVKVFLMTTHECLKELLKNSKSQACGCRKCQPDGWCREPGCQRPVESWAGWNAKGAWGPKERSTEKCFAHASDNRPDPLPKAEPPQFKSVAEIWSDRRPEFQ